MIGLMREPQPVTVFSMKTIVYWTIIAALFVGGIASQWLPFDSTINAAGVWALIFVICIVPGWLLGSSRMVKVAIECAHKSNIPGLRSLLITRGWMIFPSPKYNDIVSLLRELAKDPHKKPAFESLEFSKYIIDDGMGYILTWEGREKMLERMGRGFLTWRLIENPAVITWLLRIIVILAVLRGLAVLIGFLLHH